MEHMRAVVYLSVCLTVMTSLCQGERSSENQLPSAPEEPILGLTTSELVSVFSGRFLLRKRKPLQLVKVLICVQTLARTFDDAAE